MARSGWCTDRGRHREANEDACLVIPEQNIYMVADGVGGHNGGEFASHAAVNLAAAYFRKNPIDPAQDAEWLKDHFLTCLRQVNWAIRDLAEKSSKVAGMATTMVLLYIADGNAYVVNIGDSRAYLLRDGVLRQLTEDHTYVNQLVREGTLTSSEAASHPNRNVITRALGGENEVAPDFYQFQVFEKDLLLLCTDGLYNEIPDGALSGIATGREDMQELADSLVKSANECGGKDNITVVCVQIEKGEEEVKA
ncbi:MAG: Stp1/IreP family PP2C-type Ser/Thr phosphatase [Clostridiales bacterium]|nr:Stp1/IreP family PP2C-type Ser/Thr phosphatase [Clostridiales bacterium]